MIVVPAGPIGLKFFEAMRDPTHGNRIQSFSYHLQDNEGAPKGALSGVTGGRLEWHSNAAVKGGGKITVQQTDRDAVNWLKRRIKIVMHIEGLGDFPLGVFIPYAPAESWDDANMTLEIELLDKCSVLDQDCVANTYALAAGTNVTSAVRTLILSAGEKAGSITDSSVTLPNAMTWEPGTSKLTIINDLLQAAGYFSLIADGNGHFKVEKQILPRNRPIQYEFIDNYESIYSPIFDYEKDIYSVPNKVILIGQGDGENEAWTAVATNENANSPYSYQARGRWIVDVQKGIEATSEAALQEHAERRLAQLSSPNGVVTIDHAPLPWLHVNDAVRFRRKEAEIHIRAVIKSMLIDLDPSALARTALQEVVDL